MVISRFGVIDRSGSLRTASRLVATYVCLTFATVVVLAVLASVAPEQATDEAWWHAVIVLVFAVLLPLRMRAARRGDEGALRAVTIIAVVLLLVNLVEAVLPGAFPTWMRIEMVVIVALMGWLSFLTGRRSGPPSLP